MTVDAYAKIRMIIWDFIGADRNWVMSQLQQEKVEIVAYFVPGVDAEEVASVLGTHSGYDYVLVVDRGIVRPLVIKTLNALMVPEDRWLIIQDYYNLTKQWKISLYIFSEEMTKMIEFNHLRKDEKYSMVSFDDMIYIGNASDNVIIPHSYLLKENWAKDDMERFFEYANKYYPENSDREGYFCDIGANIGTTCIYFKKHIDTRVRILAIEPQIDNYKCLKTNCILNDIPEEDTILLHCGVSDKTSESHITFNAENPGGSFLSDNGTGETIRTYRFDDIVKEKNIKNEDIKYIWVDVEGFEGYFLKGAEETLGSIKVPVVTEFSTKYLNERGCLQLYFEMAKKIFNSFIIMQDEERTVWPIDAIDEQLTEKGKEMLLDVFYIC